MAGSPGSELVGLPEGSPGDLIVLPVPHLPMVPAVVHGLGGGAGSNPTPEWIIIPGFHVQFHSDDKGAHFGTNSTLGTSPATGADTGTLAFTGSHGSALVGQHCFIGTPGCEPLALKGKRR